MSWVDKFTPEEAKMLLERGGISDLCGWELAITGDEYVDFLEKTWKKFLCNCDKKECRGVSIRRLQVPKPPRPSSTS